MLLASMSGDELSWFGHATAERGALVADRWTGFDGASAAATIDGLSGQMRR